MGGGGAERYISSKKGVYLCPKNNLKKIDLKFIMSHIIQLHKYMQRNCLRDLTLLANKIKVPILDTCREKDNSPLGWGRGGFGGGGGSGSCHEL